MKTLKFKLASFQKLSSFLSKFSSVENQLLLEIEGDRMLAKTNTQDRSVVKYSSILLSDVFDYTEVEDCRIGFYSIPNFVKAFSCFGPDENVVLEIDIEKLDNLMVGTQIRLKSKGTNIKYPCASLRFFKYVEKSILDKIQNSPKLAMVRIQKDFYGKCENFMKIDKEAESIAFVSEDNEIAVKGGIYSSKIEGSKATEEFEVPIYKIAFAYIDKEDSEIIIAENRIIINSLDSDTMIVIGMAQ